MVNRRQSSPKIPIGFSCIGGAIGKISTSIRWIAYNILPIISYNFEEVAVNFTSIEFRECGNSSQADGKL